MSRGASAAGAVRAIRFLRTRHPRTFREKVRYKMLRDHRPLLVTFADKAAVRAHVAAAVGEHYLPVAYAIVDDPGELQDMALPGNSSSSPRTAAGPRSSYPSPLRKMRDCRRSRAAGCTGMCGRNSRRATTSCGFHAGWVAQLYGQGPNREWAYGSCPAACHRGGAARRRRRRHPRRLQVLRLPRTVCVRAGGHRAVRAAHAGLLPAGLAARATEWRTAVGSSGAAEAVRDSPR